MSENHYQILGIPRDSDEREIKKAYHRLARELHPDKAATPDQAREMEHKFALASTAYNVLKDPEQRRDYDRRTFGEAGGSAPRPSTPSSPSPASGPSATGARPAPQPSASGAQSAPQTAAIRQAAPAAAPAKPAAGQPVEVDERRAQIGQKAFAKGMQLFKAKDYAHAVEFFEAAISNNPNEAIYHARLATALIEAKKSAAKAIEAAQRAIEMDRYNLEYRFTLAHIYEAIGSKSNAIKAYEEILKWDKDNVAAKQMLRTLTKTHSMLDSVSEASPILGSILSPFRKKNPYK